MNRLVVELKYIGTNYVGWQVQKNGKSVQSAVQDAIEKIYGQRVDVTGCSRTDSGVHANGYRFCFMPPKPTTSYRALAALNFALPEDMGVVSCEEVDDDFHPRYSAVAKEYVYKLYDGRARNPFLNGLAWHYVGSLNTELMQTAANQLVGTHDFCSFMAQGSKIVDTVRTIYRCNVKRESDCVTITVCGDGFLYKMVRIIVGTLVGVSENKISANSITDIINAKSRTAAGKTAPPHGLYLNRVFYSLKEVQQDA